MKRLIYIILLYFILVSCSAKFACKDVVNLDGEQCDSIKSVYEKKMLGADETPSKGNVKKSGDKQQKGVTHSYPSEEAGVVRSLFYEEGKPLRLPPRVIRIWIAPWEDSDGDLHQPSYIYSEISPKRGRWLLGERETVTSQPVLRPIEKNVDKQTLESGKEDTKKENIVEKASQTRKGKEFIGPSIQTEVSGTR